MRLYFINNMYLSSIQQGIQAGHAAVELMHKYCASGMEDPSHSEMVLDWAQNHKTFIVLNGGYSKSLENVLIMLHSQQTFPFAAFNEEQDSLNGALTSVCALLPDWMYDTMKFVRESDIDYFSFENMKQWMPTIGYEDSQHSTEWFRDELIVQLMYKLNQFSLAH